MNLKSYFFLLLCAACVNNASDKETSYKKTDLQQLRWIEGNWKGMDGQTPFYEIYKITNDSTLEISSYNWNGTDSSATSRSYVHWKNDQYHLGDSLNWKVTQIGRDSIYMVPVYKASNTILWKKTPAGWDAVLKSPKGEKVYHMERIAHFK